MKMRLAVGASDLCLYIWLLSEVLPKKIAIEKDAAYSWFFGPSTFADASRASSVIDEGGSSSTTTVEQTRMGVLKQKLQKTRIPVCADGNNVRMHYKEMLVQRLRFPRDLAASYSKPANENRVVCNAAIVLQAMRCADFSKAYAQNLARRQPRILMRRFASAALTIISSRTADLRRSSDPILRVALLMRAFLLG